MPNKLITKNLNLKKEEMLKENKLMYLIKPENNLNYLLNNITLKKHQKY